MIPEQTRAEMAMGVRMARYHELVDYMHYKYKIQIWKDPYRDNVCFRYFGADFSEPLDEFPSEELLAQLELLRLANT